MIMSKTNNEKLLTSIFTRYFIDRSDNCCSQNITIRQGSINDHFISTCNYHQLINFSNNTTSNTSTYVTLIFSSNPNLTTELCIENSLCGYSCHNSIAFYEMKLSVHYLLQIHAKVLPVIKLIKKIITAVLQ